MVATIPAGDSLSNAVDCTPGQVVRVYMPDDWNDAPLTLEVSSDNIVPYRPVYTPVGYPAKLTVVENGALLLPSDMGEGLAWIKLRSGTREAPVNQDYARAFTIVIQT